MGTSKQEHIYFFWSTSIIICMLLAFFALLFASCSRSGDEKPEDIDPALYSIQPYDPNVSPDVGDIGVIPSTDPAASTETRLAETADMGQSYIDSFVFLGDSTTYSLAHYNVVPASQVWTPISGTLTLPLWSTSTIVYEDGSEIPIIDAVTLKQPEYMLITLGVNGVSFLSEKDFVETYTALVQAIAQASPNTKIILNSIYPVTAEYDASGTGITNAKIDTANEWVERIAGSTGVKFLATESILKGEDGALPASYSNDNALHLNEQTLKRVIQYIRTHGYV